MSRKVILAVAILVLFVLVFGESTNYRLSNPFVISDTPSKYWVSIAGGSMYPGKYFSYSPDYPLDNDGLYERLKFIALSTLYFDSKITIGVNNIWKNYGAALSFGWANLENNKHWTIYYIYPTVVESKIAYALNANYCYNNQTVGMIFEYSFIKLQSSLIDSIYDNANGIGCGVFYMYCLKGIDCGQMKINPFVEVQISSALLLLADKPYAEYYPNDYHIMTAGVRLGMQFGVF
ncbi:MAG: hypothetical protein AB7T10_08480 [bacterium]